jgi:hypothetical protein
VPGRCGRCQGDGKAWPRPRARIGAAFDIPATVLLVSVDKSKELWTDLSGLAMTAAGSQGAGSEVHINLEDSEDS